MKLKIKETLFPIALGLMVAQTSYAESSVSVKPDRGNERDQKVVEVSTSSEELYVIDRNETGERIVDMTNPKHEKFVYDRLESAGVTPEKFPQLYKEHNELKELQIFKKAFPTQTLTASEEVDSNGIIKNSLFFTDSNFGVAEDNGEAYLYVKARSSVYDGTKSTYADILLQDTSGNRLAPIGSVMNYGDGKETNVISVIPLKTLRANYPDLLNVIASSYVKVTFDADDGREPISKIKYTKYPFSWAVIDKLYPPQGTVSLLSDDCDSENEDDCKLSQQPEYIGVDPIDKTGDDIVKVCLNRSHNDCDYPYDQALPNAETKVQIPFSGTMIVNHNILEIWETNEELPPELGEATNIYVQKGSRGGVSVPAYAELENGNKSFSDYITIEDIDFEKKETTLKWVIPRDEGVFGDAELFSNIDEVLWNITIAVNGFPYFEEGRFAEPENFQLTLSSEENVRFGTYYAPVLDKMKFGYSCLAKDSMISMADGSKTPIEKIAIGDLVMGALAANVETTQPMTVVDVSTGIEVIPMIQVTTREGNGLLITETHPVMTANKGIVWAKELMAGDRILTENGSVLVRSVSKQNYGDKVYNLALAPLGNSTLDKYSEFGLFADGLFVGDLSMQDKYNYKDQVEEKEETVEEALQRIPVEYHTDYLNSLEL